MCVAQSARHHQAYLEEVLHLCSNSKVQMHHMMVILCILPITPPPLPATHMHTHMHTHLADQP